MRHRKDIFTEVSLIRTGTFYYHYYFFLKNCDTCKEGGGGGVVGGFGLKGRIGDWVCVDPSIFFYTFITRHRVKSGNFVPVGVSAPLSVLWAF